MQILVSLSSIRNTVGAQGLTLLDIPPFLKQHDFTGLELSDRELPSFSPAFSRQLRESCAAVDCRLIFDVNCDLTYAEPTRWQQEVNYVKQMLNVARDLGAGAVRVCLGGQSFSVQKLWKARRAAHLEEKNDRSPRKNLTSALLLNRWVLRLAHAVRRTLPATVTALEEKMVRATSALIDVVPLAARYRLPIVIENHWGITSRPENIIAIIDAVKSPWLGACPDFGNFPRDVDPYDGLKTLAPKALHAQAKSARFCKDGEEKTIDYRRALRILRDCSYDGTLTIEYEGGGRDLEGCIRTRALILKYW